MCALEVRRVYLSGVDHFGTLGDRGGGGSTNGGEVAVVVVDVKVGWPRAAARPGRLQVQHLERTRGMLEGKLAEATTRLENTGLALEEVKAERDDLRRELVLRTAKFKRRRPRTFKTA